VRIRYALRSLAASPSFTVSSILCLSVGLALTIAAFSVINAVLFRSMPGIHEQSALRHIWILAADPRWNEVVPPSPHEYAAYRDSLADIAAVAAAVQSPVAAQLDGTTVVTRAVFISANYFQVLGTRPVVGQLLDANVEGAVVGERFWRVHLGGRDDAVGRTILVGGQSFQIIGIAPAGFVGAATGEFDDDPTTIPSIWVPLASHTGIAGTDATRPAYIRMTARLAPGSSEKVVAERVEGIAAPLAAAAGRAQRDTIVRVRPIHSGPHEEPADVAVAMAGVMVVPLGILAIGCANVANLLLARGAARSRDIAVCLALGASRARVIGELLIESLLLAVAAAALAVGFCTLAIEFVEHWMPIPVAVDWRVASFSAVAATLTALLFGLLPSVSLAGSGSIGRIHDARPLRQRTRRTLAGLQLALSAALLVIAALFVRTVTGIVGAEREDERHVLTASFAVHLAHYDRARVELFEQTLLERVRRISGVRNAGVGPYRQREGVLVRVPGVRAATYAAGGPITDGWLGAAGFALTAGRDFTAQERRGAPTAAIVNEALAALLWPSGGPLGEVVSISRPEETNAPRFEVQVVGVVKSGITGFRNRPPVPTVYLPVAISVADERTLWVRTEQPASGVAPDIRRIAADLAPGVALTDLGTLADARRATATPYRLLAGAMSAAGSLALLLAAFGLFSLLTYLVALQRRELGIRLALGARPRDVVRLVVGESTLVAIAGAIVGGIVAAVAATGLRSEFVGIGPTDPVSYLAAAAVLIGAALAASAHPALRASRTDPASVLRAE
jgi:putative ABC transport system permease protein